MVEHIIEGDQPHRLLVVGIGKGVATAEAAEKPFECMIIATGFSDYDPLRLCSQLRSIDRTRFLPVILIANEDEEELIIRGLDLGVND